MILVAGLGNPGLKYQYTRHNIGFRALDKIKEENKFPDFKKSERFNSLISEKILDSKKIILAKPQTFMNNSGEAVKKILKYHSSTKDSLIVIHDDIDILLGKIRISRGKNSAGHKGVESIIKEIGSNDFLRFRIGIRPNPEKVNNLEKFVLQKFNKEEEIILKDVLRKIPQILISQIIKNGYN